MAVLTLKNYIDSDPDKVAMPDWSEYGVTSIKNVKLSFDDIYINDIEEQFTKEETHTASEIEALRMSFAEGVDTAQFPPAVYDRGPGFDKRYVLLYGFGRTEAIRELQQKEWIFTLLSGTTECLMDVQAVENEGYPQRLNKEVDMRKHLSRKVKAGIIPNTEEAIRKEFKRIYKTRTADCRGRVVNMVMGEVETPQPYINYTSTAKVEDWIKNHSSETVVINGNFDESSDEYGVCIGEGYQYRVVFQALKRYRETGKMTYLVGHVKPPTPKTSLTDKRKKFVEQLKELRMDCENAGMKVFPLRIRGFLPQERGVENLKTLVSV